MKLTLIALAIAIICRLAFEVATAQTVEIPRQFVTQYGDAVTFAGGVSGEWLAVRRHNVHDYQDRGYDPSYVNIICQFKPIVTKLPDGTWQIQFISEIASGLP